MHSGLLWCRGAGAPTPLFEAEGSAQGCAAFANASGLRFLSGPGYSKGFSGPVLLSNLMRSASTAFKVHSFSSLKSRQLVAKSAAGRAMPRSSSATLWRCFEKECLKACSCVSPSCWTVVMALLLPGLTRGSV